MDTPPTNATNKKNEKVFNIIIVILCILIVILFFLIIYNVLPFFKSKRISTPQLNPQPTISKTPETSPPSAKYFVIKPGSSETLVAVPRILIKNTKSMYRYAYTNKYNVLLPETPVDITVKLTFQELRSLPGYENRLPENIHAAFFITPNIDIKDQTRRLLILAYDKDTWRFQYAIKDGYPVDIPLWTTSQSNGTFTIHLDPDGKKGYVELPDKSHKPFTLPQSLYEDPNQRFIRTGFSRIGSTVAQVNSLQISAARTK